MNATMRQRLDQTLVRLKLVSTRSQAESYIKLGLVKVNNQVAAKPGVLVSQTDKIVFESEVQYVSRAALKLGSVAQLLKLSFKDKVVLDVGSSTGGFSDYALQHGALKVIAVDVGSNQMNPKLRTDLRIELHEQTDIRKFTTTQHIDLILIDVSFISLRQILPYLRDNLCDQQTQIVAMVKPQFEADNVRLKHRGVIKNDRLRRKVLLSFETWVRDLFVVIDKADSLVAGAHGNKERFYVLRKP